MRFTVAAAAAAEAMDAESETHTQPIGTPQTVTKGLASLLRYASLVSVNNQPNISNMVLTGFDPTISEPRSEHSDMDSDDSDFEVRYSCQELVTRLKNDDHLIIT